LAFIPFCLIRVHPRESAAKYLSGAAAMSVEARGPKFDARRLSFEAR
jgi:hypothetical protein